VTSPENSYFWHKTVTTKQIESYISKRAGIDLSRVFDQYLRTINIPVLRYQINGKTVSYKYENTVKGFAMPIRVSVNGTDMYLTPRDKRQKFEFSGDVTTFVVDRNFYVVSKGAE